MLFSAGDDEDIFSTIKDDWLATIDLSGAITSVKQSPTGNSPLLRPASSEEDDRATTSKAKLAPEGTAATEGGMHLCTGNARPAQGGIAAATAEADTQYAAAGAVTTSALEAPALAA